jgi:Tfp pilus assembly protein PilF
MPSPTNLFSPRLCALHAGIVLAIFSSLFIFPLDCLARDSGSESTAAIEAGKACLKKDDVAGALAAFTKVIEFDRKNAQAYISRACAYKRNGDEEKASADISEAIRLDPKAARVYFLRNWAYGREREIDRVIHYVYGRVDVSEPAATRGDAKAAPWEFTFRCRAEDAAALGSWHFYKGEYKGCIEGYSAVVRLKPKDALARSVRGLAFLEAGDVDKAIADSTEAIRLNPKAAEAYACRAVAYAEKRTLDKSDADSKKAIALAPSLSYVVFSRGYVLCKMGDRAEADKHFAEAVRLEAAQRHEMELKGLRDLLADVYTLALVYLDLGELQYVENWKFLRLAPKQEPALRAIIAEYTDRCIEADENMKKSSRPTSNPNEVPAGHAFPFSRKLAKTAIVRIKETLTSEQWKAYNRLRFIPAAEKVIWNPEWYESLHMTQWQRDQVARLSKECRNSLDFPDEPRMIPYQVPDIDSLKDTWEEETKKKAKAVAPEPETKNEIRGEQLARENAKKALGVLTPEQQDKLLELLAKEAHRE